MDFPKKGSFLGRCRPTGLVCDRLLGEAHTHGTLEIACTSKIIDNSYYLMLKKSLQYLIAWIVLMGNVNGHDLSAI